MKKYFFLSIFLLSLVLHGQHNISGLVKDKNSKKPLPFATIILSNGIGEITDTDGRFSISSKDSITACTISYIGYKTQKIIINETKNFYQIRLEPLTESLDEIVLVAEEDPALKIIRKTIENKNKNNSLKVLNSFTHKSYTKLLVTANPDSINSTVDSIFIIKNGKRVFKKLDSTNYEFKKQIDKQHLYITEKISEHKFQRGKNKKELILASRMAGFKNPVYEILALGIENFSFYEENYTLLGNTYINPLANNALKKYRYKVLDTIFHKDHNSYMIYFKPKEVRKTIGLEGVLYIHDKSYALEKGIAELKGIANIKASQSFEYRSSHNIWFPSETQIIIRKGKSKEAITLFGGAVKFSASENNDSISRTNSKDPSDIIYLTSKVKNFDIKLNEPVQVLNSASVIEIDDNAANRDKEFWQTHRIDSLSNRGFETYRFLDSVSQKEKVEKKLNLARKILKGYYPTTYFDFDLSQLINFNNYEGFRFGLGGVTNSNFSRKIKIEGYTAYGFKDKETKYHIASQLRLNKMNNTWIGIGYTKDLQEAAKLNFLFEDSSFSLINPRNLNISQFFNYETFSGNIQHDIFPNLEAKVRLEKGKYQPLFDYHFVEQELIADYNLSLASLALHWTPFGKYMNTPSGKLTVKKGYPNMTFQVTKSFDNFLNGDLDFTQFNFKVTHRIRYLNTSFSELLIQGGLVSGDVPITHLYNAFPNYSRKNPWIKRVNFSGTNAFETMVFNEFISDKYISLQLRHNFKPFNLGRKFKPTLSLLTRFAIGDIKNQEDHLGITFKKMNKGYIESGLILNNLFKGFGIGSFYRYGAYSNTVFSDNLAVKLTYVLKLGF